MYLDNQERLLLVLVLVAAHAFRLIASPAIVLGIFLHLPLADVFQQTWKDLPPLGVGFKPETLKANKQMFCKAQKQAKTNSFPNGLCKWSRTHATNASE